MEDRFALLENLFVQRNRTREYFANHRGADQAAELTEDSFNKLITAEITRLAVETLNPEIGEDQDENDD